jgi:hypothetical protein
MIQDLGHGQPFARRSVSPERLLSSTSTILERLCLFLPSLLFAGFLHVTMASGRLRSALQGLVCVLLLACLPRARAQEQVIECLVPHKMGNGQRPVYKTGETVQFQWKSTFPRFDLTITQVNSETQDKTNDSVFGRRVPPEPKRACKVDWLTWCRE